MINYALAAMFVHNCLQDGRSNNKDVNITSRLRSALFFLKNRFGMTTEQAETFVASYVLVWSQAQARKKTS